MQWTYGLDELRNIEIGLFLPILLPLLAVSALLVAVALIDLYRNRKSRKHVLAWTLIIIFANTLGPVLYFVIGRKEREVRETGSVQRH